MAALDASGRVDGVAGRGLGLLILVVLAWKVLGLFGQFPAVLGGSLNQVLMPLVATIAFLRTRQRASATITLFWTGQSITDVYILGRLGLLDWAEAVGRLFFAAGVLTMLAAILFMALEFLRCLNARAPEPDVEAR